MKNPLEEISKKLADTEREANVCLDDIPASGRPGWGSIVSAAKGRLKDEIEAHREAVSKAGLALFVDGTPEQESQLGDLIQAENEGVAVNALALFERLADQIEPVMAASRTWGVAHTQRFHGALMEVMSELGVKELDMPDTKGFPILETRSDTLTYLQKVMGGASGLLNRLYVKKMTADAVRAIRYTGMTVPVLLKQVAVQDRKDLAKIFGKGTATVEIPENETPTKEFMQKAFAQIANKRKGKTNE